MKDKESGRVAMDAREGTLLEAFADPWELNVPELSNGAAVHRISKQAADKEYELFVLTGEQYFIFLSFINCVHGYCKYASVIQVDIFKLLTVVQMINYSFE